MKKLNSIYEISFSKFRILVQNSLGWKDRERGFGRLGERITETGLGAKGAGSREQQERDGRE